jgi:hypothetical protein
LRSLTKVKENESDSEEVDADEIQENKEWSEFCTKKIDKIERLWNRKLENSDNGSEDEQGEG